MLFNYSSGFTMNGEEDPNKPEGHLQLTINRFSKFAHERDGRRLSEPVQLLGFQWRILAISHSKEFYQPKRLGLFLQCSGNDADPTWACSASATMKMLAQKKDKPDYIHKLSSHQYRSDVPAWGMSKFMSFQMLMNPENGWYDEADDSIVLSAHFKLDVPLGIRCFVARKHVLLVNGEEVNVNKHNLASNSDFFDRFFFGQDALHYNNRLAIGLPANVGHFRRMLDTLNPVNRPLDDECIEGVSHLASQFVVPEVHVKCHNFLAKESKHSAIFKFRLADKYGFHKLKKQLLNLPAEEFIKEADFRENLREYAKLDEKAREALDARIGQLLGTEKSSGVVL